MSNDGYSRQICVRTETYNNIKRFKEDSGISTLFEALAVLVRLGLEHPRLPHPSPPPDYGAIFDAWEALIWPADSGIIGRVISARPEAAERLFAALSAAGYSTSARTPHAVGVVFRSLRGAPHGGRRLACRPGSGNVAMRWYVERVPAPAGQGQDGQAPGHAAAGAVAGP